MRNFQDGVEIVIEDFNGIPKDVSRELYDRTIYEIINKKENAFFADSFKVGFVNGTQVSVAEGTGFQTDNTQIAPEPTKRLIYAAAAQNLTIDPPDASNDRIDIIIVKSDFVATETATRKYKDAIDSSISNQTVTTAKDWSNELAIVKGTPAGSPSAPSVTAGYIKLAEVYVTAVSGIANSAAITDSRAIIPVGSKTVISTLGYNRLTVGSAVDLETLFADIDALLKNGYFEYYDLDELGAHPSAPGATKRRIYIYNNLLYQQDSSGTKIPIGSGGGGGGGLILTEPDGKAPLKVEEYGVDVYKYVDGDTQELNVYMKVPESYIAGTQIKLFFGSYSPSAANTFLMLTNAGLVRIDNDAIDTPIANRDSTNSALTNTVAKQYRKVECDLTDSSGEIGGYAVQPGDLLLIKIKRGTGTDTEDVRFLPSTLEPKFSL